MTEIMSNNELNELKSEIETLRQEMSRMKSEQNVSIVPAMEQRTSRRKLLKKMGIAAAAVAAAGVASGAMNIDSASAANGQPVILGNFGNNANTQTSATEIRSTTTNINGAVLFVQQGSAMSNPVGMDSYAAISALTDGTGEIHDGVFGKTTDKIGAGVLGRHTGSTVSDTAAGVAGSGFNAPGVLGISENTYGVSGKSNSATGTGVKGQGKSFGVIGVTTDIKAGTGVFGQGQTGVYAYTNAVGGNALEANHDSTFPNDFRNAAIKVTSRIGRGLIIDAQAESHILMLPNPTDDNANVPVVFAERGALYVNKTGILWYNTGIAPNGGWRKLAGGATAGQLHLMATPVRVAATLGNNPMPKLTSVGATPADSGTSTAFIQVGGVAGIPKEALAITGVLTSVGATSGGNLRFWSGTTVPDAVALNITGALATPPNLSVSYTVALDADGKVKLGFGSGAAGAQCGFALDVTGYYL